MTWAAHQRVPFFGYTLGEQGKAPQMRWTSRVDIDTAFSEAADILEAFSRWMKWPEAQPFTGGILDAWPQRMTDGLSFCRREWAAIQAYLKVEVAHE